jgi:hypothetical protein
MISRATVQDFLLLTQIPEPDGRVCSYSASTSGVDASIDDQQADAAGITQSL